jgi:hypothetical protein
MRTLKGITVLAAAAALLALASCATPHSVTRGAGNNGLFALMVDPASAEVYVDGVLVGEADRFDGQPGYLEIASGTHRLEFKKAGYLPWARDVYSSNAVQEVHVTLTPAPK